MMGPKKLSTIRQELYDAIAATGENPILWAEQRMTNAKREAPEKNYVLEAVCRALKSAKKQSTRKPRIAKKK